MKTKDSLSKHYEHLLESTYDCVDRIVLNAYCPMLLVAGGVRKWYRIIHGSDEDMSNATMMKFAGRFSRRVQSLCKKKNIPFIHFGVGERKHHKAEELIPQDKSFTGLFAVFVSRAPSLLWEIKRYGNGGIKIERKQSLSLVNHYYFHMIDRQWGHITLRMCAHPPFSCNIILNGHEWVERRKGFQLLQVTKQSNCFTSYKNGEKLSLIADTLKFNGQLDQVCQRWIYRCLWFVMDQKQQRDTAMQYKFSIYQIEYSRNLLFKRGRQMDAVYQKIIDLTRGPLDIKRLKTIFGKNRRPYKHKSTAPAPQVCVETPDYNLTIFKIHFGRLTVKLYDKGERTLRAEVVVHNAKDLKCKRGIEWFGSIVEKLESIMESFLSHLNYAHIATIDDGTFEKITKPTQKGNNRLAGIDFQNKRIKQVAMVLLGLSLKPGGFISKDLTDEMRARFDPNYTSRNAGYDLKKFRGKNMVKKLNGQIKYVLTQQGMATITAILCLMYKDLPALTCLLKSPYQKIATLQLSELDKHFFRIQEECELIRQLNGLKLVA